MYSHGASSTTSYDQQPIETYNARIFSGFLRSETGAAGTSCFYGIRGFKGEPNQMNHREEHIYNSFIAFRAPTNLRVRFQQFSKDVGRNKSALARYLLGECMNAYEGKKDAITKIRQELY